MGRGEEWVVLALLVEGGQGGWYGFLWAEGRLKDSDLEDVAVESWSDSCLERVSSSFLALRRGLGSHIGRG
jgi:hypothetical protein